MNVADRTLVASVSDVDRIMLDIGTKAKAAAAKLAFVPTEQKNQALHAMAKAVRGRQTQILADNAMDVADAVAGGMAESFVDRLKLTPQRIEAMAAGLEAVAGLPDPVGTILAAWERPNGLKIERVRTPLGVIGIIYESRPNVTADAGALCLKAGNAAILRGGSDSLRSTRAIHAALVAGLEAAKLPPEAIQIVPVADRAAVGKMLAGLDGAIDVIVPRGGKSLVARVQDEARVPVFAHLEGICHVYVDKAAVLEMALPIVVNAKMRRTGICGAAETLLIDRFVIDTHLRPIVAALREAGCTIRGDERIRREIPDIEAATEADWTTEYLDAIISVKAVAGLDDAINHINRYGSHHTDAIITRDRASAQRFMDRVDSAIVLHNASTQFADGGEFGMGAEIGIATGKFHARGPVGVEQLTSFKYMVRGNGQTRP